MTKVLVVEDEIESFELIARYIKQVIPDCKILHAVSGEIALQIMHQEGVDALFVDRGFPDGMDGLDFVKKIQSDILYLTLPLVFVTATDANKDEVMRKYKNFEYILKPYTEEQFMSKLRDFLLSIKARKKIELFDQRRSFLVSGVLEVVKVEDVLFAEVSNRHISLYTVGEIYTPIVMPLAELIDKMNDPLFVKCHKSFAVNARKIRKIMVSPSNAYELSFEETNHKCQLGLSYKDNIVDLVRNR